MLVKADVVPQSRLAPSSAAYSALFIVLSLAVAAAAFSGSLAELAHRWTSQEEYSHGFLIPVIVAWLVWSRRNALLGSIGTPSWAGPALVALAGALHILGKLSALFVLSQLGFIVALLGITLGIGGAPLLRVMFVPIIFLLFAIPMPYFIDSVLSYRLQLVSSELGTAFIRLFQIPVFLEGNVIDLGVYKLQVVEACSGLRYLYPLMSLGFLAAYLFQAPIWQRALVFLSTIPITILMNSFRIGVVGLLVDHFGPQDADGFLHMFEGWIIFIACAGVLVGEMTLLTRYAERKRFFDVFHPPQVSASLAASHPSPPFGGIPLAICFLALCVTGIVTLFVSARSEILPERQNFATFPTMVGAWTGHTGTLDVQTKDYLGLTDYILSDYAKKGGIPVNLYVAYYATQRSGVSPHSPSVCIPGNGWQITDFKRIEYTSDDGKISLPLNRVVIKRDTEAQLVYYWFDERGTQIANEYISKLYLLRDAMFKNRTDGALVRLTTPVDPTEGEAHAEQRLREFTRIIVPALKGYLPAPVSSSAASAKSEKGHS